MKIKSINSKLKRQELAKKLGHSSFTLQRHRNDIKVQILINQTHPENLQRLQMRAPLTVHKPNMNSKDPK